MPSPPPSIQKFVYQAAFGASLGYLVISVVLLLPTGLFGVASVLLASFATAGSWRALKAERAKEEVLKREPADPADRS